MSFYKNFSDHDRVVSSHPLYESITNASGTTGWATSSYPPENFVQFGSGNTNFALATHVFDLTFGMYTGSVSGISDNQKLQYTIYNQFSKMLLGHDVDNNIKKFEAIEGVQQITNPEYLPYSYIINLARSQTKDRVEYNKFNMQVVVSSSNGVTGSVYVNDKNSVINSAADGHHYGRLEASSSDAGLLANSVSTSSVGYIFYEAGVVILSPYIFAQSGSSTNITGSSVMNNVCGILNTNRASFANSLSSSLNDSNTTIKNYCEFLKNKIHSIEYYSVTELNSTIYFCRAFNHEFNYSSNPTYINNGEIIVKNGDPEEPSRTYITTVGLYSDDNQLLAVAKLSEPILKTKDNELIARVRLDW